ncbi:dual specificity protein phosphatase family protein [Chitinimonas viridis]|uniref:Dual specificity protein phosphatase family protein n=1 Tax=Chitinimonas viridis TaxID=664880 RepID=A0ABT8AYZ8_9NEIS|nr:dual specificity protein phosphatase family protein [Chitinimonas viridis]MDN3575212.1 dual specificity protein phosphatase family protein [Chitinimonas viridis]
MNTPARPNANSYWVLPGSLLAGEYPRDKDDGSSTAKLAAYLAAGINHFIDLTEDGELAPYQPLLPAGADIIHQRFAIADKSVPASAGQMRAILDAITAALVQGRRVYVHCWGGVGRTGTVVGCYLIEQGMSPAAALQTLQAHWLTVAKSTRLPHSPETPAQQEWVASWPGRETQPSRLMDW